MSVHRSSSIAVVGAGGFAREVLFLLDRLDALANVRCLYESDDVWEKRQVHGFDVLPLSQLRARHSGFVIAVGDSGVRERLKSRLPSDANFPILVDPGAVVSKSVELGPGSIVCAGAIITTDVCIGRHVHVDRTVNVGHDCTIEDYATLAPAAVISGNCRLGRSVYVGAAACLRERVSVGDHAIIGMGAVVVKDVPPARTHVGNPARELTK